VNEREDAPEGAVQRNVRMSETLFRQLGASRVDWGEPDAEGFYTPTLTAAGSSGSGPRGPATPPTLDAGPEVMAWFHESEEICSHELEPWPCQIMTDHLLRDFAVEPRLTVNPDGTAQYPPRHFHRLEVAARLSGDLQRLQPAALQAAEDRT
jgi:hypothetical protein